MVKAQALLMVVMLLFIPLPNNGQNDDVCLVPCNGIVNGGPGIDGIPSIDNPVYITKDEADKQWKGSDLVAGVVIDGQAYAFPYLIMNWHEIVNDVFGNVRYALTYCPLTGSALLFDRDKSIGGATFGVSGKLFQNNLVMYDRDTMTYYSQMYHIGIKGKDIGNLLDPVPIVETTWRAWSQLFPDTVVLSTETGYSRDYSRSPYGIYDESKSIYFSTHYDFEKEPDKLYHPKNKTVVITTNEGVHAVPFGVLKDNPAYVLDSTNESIVIFFIGEENLALTYYFDPAVSGSSFKKLDEIDSSTHFPLFEDENGNKWNILGKSIDSDKSLFQVNSFNAFWFAVISFYPNAFYHLNNGTVQYQTTNDLNITGYSINDSKSYNGPFLLNLLVIPTLLLIVMISNKKRKYS